MKPDPFYIKRYSRWNPRRFFPTLLGRLNNRLSSLRFESYALPIKTVDSLPALVEQPEWQNTALRATDLQYLYLLCEICNQESIAGAIVEIGSFRGVTTRFLAQVACPRSVFAVDPYRGYGGVEHDYRHFCRNTRDMANIHHMYMTSGDAYRAWQHGPVAIVFVDAVHDYPNTNFDLLA
jgi:hypothetical protein